MLANTNGRLALALAAAGAAWPSVHCALAAAMASPLERAVNAAWCGAGPHVGAHAFCPVGIAGAAALLLLSALVFARGARWKAMPA
jgi:hypothetical protein